MRKLPKFSYLIVFSVCLIAGFLVGSSSGRATEAGEQDRFAGMATPPASPAANTESPIISDDIATPSPEETSIKGNGQRNILVIGVDYMETPEPRLESLWLVMYVPQTPGLTMLPLYPGSMENMQIQDQQLETTFRLNANHEPYPEFLGTLKNSGIWWTNYAVMDEIGLAELINLAGGLEAGDIRIDGLRAVAAVPHPWVDSQNALFGQTMLLDLLCRNPDVADLEPAEVFKQLNYHLKTDLDPQQIATDMQSLHISGSSFCKFPVRVEETPPPQPDQ